MPSKKLPFGFFVILSAMSFHASSDSPPPPPQQQQQQQEEKRGNTGRRRALKKLPLILFFVLSTITILRLLWIMTSTSSSSPAPLLWGSSPLQGCPTQSPGCVKAPPQASNNLTHHTTAPKAANLTTKEIRLLSDLISSKAPCNLLVFGLNPQFSLLVALNAGGTTIFLEDDVEKIRATTAKINATQIYKVEHNMEAGKAYELLRRARADPTCTPQAGPLQASGCPLALALLPKVVYERKWDVVLIDGPSGHNMEAPGRMAAIYSAGVMARTGNAADVLVHDIDRMIEKWYSWEFLCDENLVSSKGKLWHFRIVGNSNSTSFCSNEAIHID
ncbi:glucuronoxylan 4-O-methyltransferase 1 [Magnolia sinica]|uniref:glucuronoxylan 4-O-methyltransferase 1 n=1 Tax=Magnolia sinica TaxID=86752 RepID=UPI00265AC59E|nr:glucuronoxylan 4-O-methyltransferase 1 [Magnolia sinica]